MLAIMSGHPIQYQVPLWQALARDGRVPFEVWYVMDHGVRVSHDPEFGKAFKWDLQSLEGYPSRYLRASASAVPSSFARSRLMEDLSDRLRQSRAKALWIQGWQLAAYWQAAWAAKRGGAELWLRAESNDLRRTAPWKRGIRRLALGRLFGRIDRFLYVGEANRRLYESFGVPADRLYRAPYAIDNAKFTALAAALAPRRETLRAKWGIAHDAFCVLFCGKFIEKKHPADLVEAARKLAVEYGTRVHLLFVGSGALGARMRAACDTVYDAEAAPSTSSSPEPTKPRASFAGFLNQSEISEAYAAADCLVLPSDSGETWGLVVNEAMASGLPCAASRLCGCTEDLITPHWPRRVFECGDISGIATAIADIMAGDRSGQTYRACVASHSFDATIEQVVKLYQLVAARP